MKCFYKFLHNTSEYVSDLQAIATTDYEDFDYGKELKIIKKQFNCQTQAWFLHPKSAFIYHIAVVQ